MTNINCFIVFEKNKGIPGKVLLTPIWQIAHDIHDNNIRHVSIFALLSDIEDEYWIEYTNRRFYDKLYIWCPYTCIEIILL